MSAVRPKLSELTAVKFKSTKYRVTWSEYRIQRIDELFLSAARHARHNAVGIILSGTLWDGVEGLRAIHDAGGKCIVQDPGEAAVEDMPRNALKSVDVDFVGTTDEIASLLVELAAGRSCQ
jgi:two-component system chemotaxis response regulator CheB